LHDHKMTGPLCAAKGENPNPKEGA
jgi:hypothetical protein